MRSGVMIRSIERNSHDMASPPTTASAWPCSATLKTSPWACAMRSTKVRHQAHPGAPAAQEAPSWSRRPIATGSATRASRPPCTRRTFELIEIPHVRQSGKNSADIRLVVDALDLCYAKSHVNTFVIISGDSDFRRSVSKLRENNKQVIGVGVKQSTSDLLIANCDEFIFYDDLVRENQRAQARRQSPGSNPPPAVKPHARRRTQPQSRAGRPPHPGRGDGGWNLCEGPGHRRGRPMKDLARCS